MIDKGLTATYTEIEVYQETFKTVVAELSDITVGDLKPIEYRNAEVEALIDDYLSFTGKKPEPFELALLTNYILADTLLDPTPYKSANEEYPIENNYQRNKATYREVSMETDILDYVHSKLHLKLDSLYKVSRAEKGD